MRMKIGFVVLVALAFALNGCKKAGDPSKQIAVIAKSTTNSYWQAVHDGAAKAAAEEKVEIIWTGPLSEDKHVEQAAMVDNMVNSGVAGIVIAPTNSTALQGPIDAAIGKGVPVVLIDSGLDDTSKVVSLVSTDNYAAGKQAADALAKAVGDKKPFGGKVVMLKYLEGSGSTMKREKGFADRIKELGFTLVDQKFVKGTGSVNDAEDTADALLAGVTVNNVVQVDGIFASNQPMAIGMLGKIEKLKKSGVAVNAPFVGFDADKVLLAAVRDGRMAAIVTQDPKQMGYMGVKSMVAHLAGKKVDPSIATATATVTRENIDKPEIKAVTLEP